MNQGSRESGSGIAPRRNMPRATSSYSVVVRGRPAAVVGRQPLGEHDAEHRGHTREHVRQPAPGDDRADACLHRETGPGDGAQRVRVAHDGQHLGGRGSGDPVAGIRAAVADVLGQHAHDVPPATERGGRIAVAHGLGIRGQVRRDAEQLRRATLGDPEAGLDLIEDEQRPELAGHLPDALQEALLGQDALGVAEDGLDDDRGDVLALALEDAAQALEVVVDRGDDGLLDGLRDAPTPGQPDRLRRGHPGR